MFGIMNYHDTLLSGNGQSLLNGHINAYGKSKFMNAYCQTMMNQDFWYNEKKTLIISITAHNCSLSLAYIANSGMERVS